MRPTFLVIGAARSGTTTLFNQLSAHPEIYLPREKRPEPHFFLKDAEYEQGLAYYEDRWFAGAKEPARGEVSTSYLYQPWVPERIHAHYPDMQFIALLRNPVERAWSNYWHSVRNGLETESFDFAVRNEARRMAETEDSWRQIAPFAYVDRGMYARQFERYFEFFPRRQFLVMIYEDFFAHPLPGLNRICEFLGADESFSDWPELAVSNKSAPDQQQLDAETRAYLDRVFDQPNRDLAGLLGMDLSCWSH